MSVHSQSTGGALLRPLPPPSRVDTPVNGHHGKRMFVLGSAATATAAAAEAEADALVVMAR